MESMVPEIFVNWPMIGLKSGLIECRSILRDEASVYFNVTAVDV